MMVMLMQRRTIPLSTVLKKEKFTIYNKRIIVVVILISFVFTEGIDNVDQ